MEGDAALPGRGGSHGECVLTHHVFPFCHRIGNASLGSFTGSAHCSNAVFGVVFSDGFLPLRTLFTQVRQGGVNALVTVSAFDIEVSNLPNPNSLVGGDSQQEGVSKVRGVELEANALVGGLRLDGNVSYLDTEDPDGYRLTSIADWQASLFALYNFTGALDGIVIGANYTFTDSDGTVTLEAAEGPRSITLPTTSRHTGNLSLGYDKGPIDVRLSGTYRDKYLDELSPEPELDRYVDDHFQLDLSAKYRFNDKVQLFYEWVNINNAKYFAYNNLGDRRNIYQYEENNWTMKAGVRMTF